MPKPLTPSPFDTIDSGTLPLPLPEIVCCYSLPATHSCVAKKNSNTLFLQIFIPFRKCVAILCQQHTRVLLKKNSNTLSFHCFWKNLLRLAEIRMQVNKNCNRLIVFRNSITFSKTMKPMQFLFTCTPWNLHLHPKWNSQAKNCCRFIAFEKTYWGWPKSECK